MCYKKAEDMLEANEPNLIKQTNSNDVLLTDTQSHML